MSTPDTRGVRPSPSLQDRPSSRRRAFVGMLAADVALPLAVFSGLRAAGVNQWLALVLGSVTPAVRLAVTALRARRVELMGLFTLSLLAIGTAIGMVTADARLLVARESYLTGVVGLWILAPCSPAGPWSSRRPCASWPRRPRSNGNATGRRGLAFVAPCAS